MFSPAPLVYQWLRDDFPAASHRLILWMIPGCPACPSGAGCYHRPYRAVRGFPWLPFEISEEERLFQQPTHDFAKKENSPGSGGMAMKVTVAAVQFLGVQGHMRDHPVEEWVRGAGASRSSKAPTRGGR